MNTLPQQPVLEVVGLDKRFHVRPSRLGERPKTVHAVSDVSFRLPAGSTLGIVGESGCGKSTTARLIMGLIERDAGDVLLDGRNTGMSGDALKILRRNVQMVFQDSSASLNPRLTIEASIMFGPVVHGTPRPEASRRARDLLARVGLEPRLYAGRYPHELSGGQRQRVNIARALAVEPRIVIFDEAVSALDKSVEAQVLNLLADLKTEFGLSYVFISHDLNVVRYISDTVLVMYLGKVVEEGPAEIIYDAPAHPYARALLASMPSLDPEARTLSAPITGDPPSPIDPPSGCRFHTRCDHAGPVCITRAPEVVRLPSRREVSCHMADATSGHALAGSIAR
jgi:peptide/nickel transport system ATP-binding protein